MFYRNAHALQKNVFHLNRKEFMKFKNYRIALSYNFRFKFLSIKTCLVLEIESKGFKMKSYFEKIAFGAFHGKQLNYGLKLHLCFYDG